MKNFEMNQLSNDGVLYNEIMHINYIRNRNRNRDINGNKD